MNIVPAVIDILPSAERALPSTARHQPPTLAAGAASAPDPVSQRKLQVSPDTRRRQGTTPALRIGARTVAASRQPDVFPLRVLASGGWSLRRRLTLQDKCPIFRTCAQDLSQVP